MNNIDPEITKKLVFASISNGDWQVMDLLVGSGHMSSLEYKKLQPKKQFPTPTPPSIHKSEQSDNGGWYKNSVEGLIKAAVSTGDKNIISWAIDYINNLPTPPMISLQEIAFEKPNAISQEYDSLKNFGMSDKMALISSLPKTKDIDHIKKVLNNSLYDVIQTYGEDAFLKSKEKITRAKQQNPEINDSAESIANQAIRGSAIRPRGSEESILILNPMGYNPESSQYKSIIKELINSTKTKSATVFDYLQKYDEFKDIPRIWKADASLDAPAMINKLQQKLGALIKELAGNLIINMKKAKGKKDSAGDLLYKLPSQMKLQLRKFGLSDDDMDSIITHNSIVPIKKNPRENTDTISKDLVSTYIRLNKWESEYESKPTQTKTDQEDLPPKKLEDLYVGAAERPRVSSKEPKDIDKALKDIKQLETEIESLEVELKTTNYTVKEKQKRLEDLSNKRKQLNNIRGIVDRSVVGKAKQKSAQSTEIERLIEAMPEKEKQIRNLARAGHSFGDIVELIS
jgi:hypothetical protein